MVRLLQGTKSKEKNQRSKRSRGSSVVRTQFDNNREMLLAPHDGQIETNIMLQLKVVVVHVELYIASQGISTWKHERQLIGLPGTTGAE